MIDIILAIILLSFVIGFQVFLDAKDINHVNLIRKELMAIAKKKVQKSVVVVIEIGRSVKEIEPLLDHLASFEYNKIEIIILKKSISDHVRKTLTNYKKSYRFSRFEMFEIKKKVSLIDIIRNNSKGQLILRLGCKSRLSKNFFELISIESAINKDDIVIIPSSHYVLGKSIASALQVQRSIINQVKNRIFKSKVDMQLLEHGIVYKRIFLLNTSSKNISQKNLALPHIYLANPVPKTSLREYFVWMVKKYSLNTIRFGLVFLGVVSVVLMVSFLPRKVSVYAISLASVYLFFNLALQMRVNGYSLIDRINLLMLLPVNFVFEVIASLGGVLALSFRVVSRLFNNRSK